MNLLALFAFLTLMAWLAAIVVLAVERFPWESDEAFARKREAEIRRKTVV